MRTIKRLPNTRATRAIPVPMYVQARIGSVVDPVIPSSAKFQSFQPFHLGFPAARGVLRPCGCRRNSHPFVRGHAVGVSLAASGHRHPYPCLYDGLFRLFCRPLRLHLQSSRQWSLALMRFLAVSLVVLCQSSLVVKFCIAARLASMISLLVAALSRKLVF